MTKRKRSRHSARKGIGISLSAIMVMAAVAIVAVGAWKIFAAGGRDNGSTQIPDSLDLTYVITEESLPEQLVTYPGMDVSFNAGMHIPNWVAWELTAAETDGPVKRENKFYNDPDVEGCAETYDYSYSGYNRGHMAPAADMKWSREAMHGSFSLANICPQVNSLNTGTWRNLEDKCRQWAQADSAIIIVCGPILTDCIREYIGDTRVAVPKRFFKVILSPYAKPARGIGFIMPNDKAPGGIQATAVSIDEVERITGHDFFSALPDDIEAEVESQCDFHYWSTIKPKNKKK